MSDPYRIDAHKLHLHPQRVAQWLAGENIAPIYMEVSPSGACNHRCTFCGLDFMGYKPRFLPTDIMQDRFAEMGELGVKSIMFAGEGEPFLHKNMAALTEAAHSAGINTAFTTNGVLLRGETAQRVLPLTSWIKVSCNAGTPETYARVHGTQAEDFQKVMHHAEHVVRLREESNCACTLGFQMVLLPENMHEALELAQRVHDLGADYLVIKPYSQHPQSHAQGYTPLSFDPQTLESLTKLESGRFKIIYREEATHRGTCGIKNYERCLALPFWSYLDATGQLWGCSMFLGKENFAYGNLLEHSFATLWHGEQRRQSLDWCHKHLDATHCRVNCRMDPINTYLWELTHPNAHVNFI